MIYMFCLYHFSLKCIIKKNLYHRTGPFKLNIKIFINPTTRISADKRWTPICRPAIRVSTGDEHRSEDLPSGSRQEMNTDLKTCHQGLDRRWTTICRLAIRVSTGDEHRSVELPSGSRQEMNTDLKTCHQGLDRRGCFKPFNVKINYKDIISSVKCKDADYLCFNLTKNKSTFSTE